MFGLVESIIVCFFRKNARNFILNFSLFLLLIPTASCKAEDISYYYIGRIPIPTTCSYMQPFIELNDNETVLFTDADDITASLDYIFTSGNRVTYMQVSNKRVLLVMLRDSHTMFFRIIQYDSTSNDYHITQSPDLPYQTNFDFYHSNNSIIVYIPYSKTLPVDANISWNDEPDFIALTINETAPFFWTITSYTNLRTYIADANGTMGSFIFNDINLPDVNYEWSAHIRSDVDSFNIAELINTGEQYDAIFCNRPSLSDNWDDSQ